MKKKIGIVAVVFCICILATVIIFAKIRNDKINRDWNLFSAKQTEEGLDIKIVGSNLLMQEGILVEADSQENETTPVSMINDGISDDAALRWSSDNDWEDNEHWIRIQFPHKTAIGSVRLYWERLNASNYSIEISDDGQEWETAAAFEQAPANTCQDIIFENKVKTNYLRLHITDVTKSEEDASLYYQNVSLLEMEVYGPFEDDFVLSNNIIKSGHERTLQSPKVPSVYSLEYIGCDYENLIDETGKIADTLSAIQVDIGYQLCRGSKSIELPSLSATIPGSEASESPNVLPEGYSPMEWKGSEGSYSLTESVTIFIPDSSLYQSAELLSIDLNSQFGISSEIKVISENEISSLAKEGDFFLKYTEDHSLSDEGFQLSLGASVDNITIIEGTSLSGIRYGCVSFKELLEYGNTIPKGIVRDYPRYKVRGFGIDVGRKPIPLTMLYSMVEAMSKEKMNTLHVHLNDNQIISQSEQDGTIESVLQLYSGFRLESDIQNEDGISLTSSDLYYTKEDFTKFIDTAAYYGIQIVPEIDTPAHSLSLIKVFPELGLQNDVFTADQLNLSDERTLGVVTDIWDEYLSDTDTPVFSGCNTVHIGMDEYYGNNTDFGNYLLQLTSHINQVSPDKTIRMWGSLSDMDFDYSNVSKDIQVQIWNTTWADPYEMYNAGFDIINSQNTRLYIIPGGGYDWLDTDYLANEWEPNIFVKENKSWTIPTYSSQMLGASYMLWNDMILIDGISISEEDIFSRFQKPLPIIADKLWN